MVFDFTIANLHRFNLADGRSEFFGIHDDVVLLQVLISDDASLPRNFAGCLVVITADHSNFDVSFVLDSVNNTFDVVSEWILESKSSKEYEMNQFLVKSLLEFFASLNELSIILLPLQLEVGKGNDSQWFLGHLVDNNADLLFDLWAQGH